MSTGVPMGHIDIFYKSASGNTRRCQCDEPYLLRSTEADYYLNTACATPFVRESWLWIEATFNNQFPGIRIESDVYKTLKLLTQNLKEMP